MSVTTKIECAGLARDSAPEIGSRANALRLAQNVVVRSPGVVESRPSFELLVEGAVQPPYVRALREFNGEVVMVAESAVHAWTVRDVALDAYTLPVVGAAEPPDYYAAETQFAQARDNLYGTGQYGAFVLESETVARMAGVDICVLTDYRYIGGDFTFTPADTEHSFAYEFVFVRKDSNGYTRRSPSSFRIVCVAGTDQPNPNDVGVFGSGSIFYVPTTGVGALKAGDQVEFYRSRTATGLSPQSACFLALTYTLTDDDITNKFFVPPNDTTFDDSLGAALYTNADQDAALGAKYMPPVSSALAFWARSMWFGRTVSKNRASFEIRNLWRAGVARLVRSAAYVIGNTTVTVADTSDLEPGMTWTDSFALGPTVNGTDVPANTYIVSITDATHFVMFNGALHTNATGTGGVMGPQAYSGTAGAQQGLIAERTGTAFYVAGSAVVALLGSTDGYAEGMYWTDSASGPRTLGSFVTGGTSIVEIIDGTHIRMSTLATNTGSADSYVGDTITIDGRDYYAWIAETDPNHLSRDYWVWTSTKPYCFALLPPERGELCYQYAVASLTQWINWHRLFGSLGSPGSSVAAIPTGPIDSPASIVTSSGDHDEIGPVELAVGARGILLEEQGVGGAAWTVYSSNPSAFVAMPSSVLNSENDDRPARLFWSRPDEPEAVTVLSYVDIGRQDAPILALVALRNALLVFKSDGVWRVTGSGPNAWSVDTLDPTLQLLRPEAVTALDNKAYAWCAGGFYEVDETGSRSLTSGKLDVELRTAAALVTASSFRGALVVGVQQRNLVLFGVPTTSTGSDASGKIYAYCLVTQAWTEWPMAWSHACESASLDRCYYSRPEAAAKADGNAITLEIRQMAAAYRGYDRTYDLGPSTMVSGDTVTLTLADIGTWQPRAGDWISASDGSTRFYRRILSAAFGLGLWVLQLEDGIEDGSSVMITSASDFFVTSGGAHFLIASLSAWQAHEGAVIALEWHPTAPAGLPIGALCREVQAQLDLREAPDPTVEESIPRYLVGGSTERSATRYTVESALARVATVQPLRVGVSRQIARGATIAPYFETSDIFAMRIVGASLVFEGVSERTRR